MACGPLDECYRWGVLRVWLAPSAAVLLLLTLLATAPGRDAIADDLPRARMVDDRTLEAIEQGTRFLVRTQEADGSWRSNAGKKINDTYRVFDGGENVHHVGVTSLAILSFLAGGHLPGRGPYGRTLDRAIEFVLDQVAPDTGYVSGQQTRMYSHAFGTLALAEVYGVTRDSRVRDRLQQAVEFTVKCQNETGGWRYVPFIRDSDMSVTVCQVVALRAARNVGIKVPQSTIDRALRYVIESAITEGDDRGAFKYQPAPQRFNRESFALAAAGLTTLFQAGIYDDRTLARYVAEHGIRKDPLPRIADSVEWMRANYDGIADRYPDHYFYYYGCYYAAQAMYQVGSRDPAAWARWYEMVRDHLVSRVSRRTDASGRTEGWWRSNVDDSHAYATASALLILQFPLDHLPIHQR
jgi:hypothetical protein